MMNKKHVAETVEFRNLVWWLQDVYEWCYVETEGSDKVRFDWNDNNSFYINSDLKIKGTIPEDLREKIMEKGIKIEN